jgi:hypothetical protein
MLRPRRNPFLFNKYSLGEMVDTTDLKSVPQGCQFKSDSEYFMINKR